MIVFRISYFVYAILLQNFNYYICLYYFANNFLCIIFIVMVDDLICLGYFNCNILVILFKLHY